MSKTGIHVSHLQKYFRKRKGFLGSRSTVVHALKDVSFAVAEGETYGLLGPNGSGKSTLIRALSTLLVPDGGEVHLLGHRIPGEEQEVRRKIGRVSVDAAFYKKLSARENLLYSALLYGMDKKTAERRALSILEALGMEEKFTDPLEELSRGMQQKVAITRALLINPPLLLLDEPTTGLDPKSKRDVQTFLENLRGEHGTTILLTSHDMAETERLCSRIGFIAQGSLIAEGTADELKRQSNNAASLDDAFIALAGIALDENGKSANATNGKSVNAANGQSVSTNADAPAEKK
ncbi:MAG: ABC transporter ATP-binding protein [Acidobacteria bacterium]|nr:ABC transporter ATP-binding protein [Acidobacteriota bacterium]